MDRVPSKSRGTYGYRLVYRGRVPILVLLDLAEDLKRAGRGADEVDDIGPRQLGIVEVMRAYA